MRRRPEVLEYIYRKYSEKHTSLAAAVISYRGRSALREVSKVMGLSDDVQQRHVRLDLGLVVFKDGREGGGCRRTRPNPIPRLAT